MKPGSFSIPYSSLLSDKRPSAAPEPRDPVSEGSLELFPETSSVLAVVFGLPIPFCSDLHKMAFFMWFLLFFGGFI